MNFLPLHIWLEDYREMLSVGVCNLKFADTSKLARVSYTNA